MRNARKHRRCLARSLTRRHLDRLKLRMRPGRPVPVRWIEREARLKRRLKELRDE